MGQKSVIARDARESRQMKARVRRGSKGRRLTRNNKSMGEGPGGERRRRGEKGWRQGCLCPPRGAGGWVNLSVDHPQGSTRVSLWGGGKVKEEGSWEDEGGGGGGIVVVVEQNRPT